MEGVLGPVDGGFGFLKELLEDIFIGCGICDRCGEICVIGWFLLQEGEISCGLRKTLIDSNSSLWWTGLCVCDGFVQDEIPVAADCLFG